MLILSQDWQLYGGTNSVCDTHSQFCHFAPQLQNEFPVHTPISDRSIKWWLPGKFAPGGVRPAPGPGFLLEIPNTQGIHTGQQSSAGRKHGIQLYWYVQADSGTVRYNAAPEPN